MVGEKSSHHGCQGSHCAESWHLIGAIFGPVGSPRILRSDSDLFQGCVRISHIYQIISYHIISYHIISYLYTYI